MQLSEKQLKFLRGRAHALKPIIQVGQKAINAGVIAETKRALKDHELIKLRVQGMDRETRDSVLTQLVTATDCTLVTRIGHVAVLFKPNEKLSKIPLPDSAPHSPK
jgi:RNA-binding protein